jgi:hypothetical protein
LCIKCGAVASSVNATKNQLKCQACKNEWKYLTDDDYANIIEQLENIYEIRTESIKIPEKFKKPTDPIDLRAYELYNWIKSNKLDH